MSLTGCPRRFATVPRPPMALEQGEREGSHGPPWQVLMDLNTVPPWQVIMYLNTVPPGGGGETVFPCSQILPASPPSPAPDDNPAGARPVPPPLPPSGPPPLIPPREATSPLRPRPLG